ncbi:MAG: hypothetical protein IPL20_03115 [Saprospiraceae bacterium]|nr:hypothetical protein [Saprospiraceae bacterium]
MKIIEIAGPDTSLKFPIVADGGRERVIEWISTEMGKSEDVLLVAQKGSTLINTCIIEVEHEDGLSPENFMLILLKITQLWIVIYCICTTPNI